MPMLRLIAPLTGQITPPLQVCRWEDYRAEYEENDHPVNRGLPLAVRLVWEPYGSLTLDGRRYDVRLSAHPGLEDARTWTGLAQTTLDVSELLLGTRYYWQVTERRRGRVSAESPLSWFDTHPQPPRWLSAHGIANLRDAGGWSAGPGRRVRQGMLFRSVEINSHHHLNTAARRYLIETLKVRTDLDLRGEEEKPAPALDPRRVTYVNAPVDAYDGITLPISLSGYRAAFETLAQPERYPILVHCWGGADRTGTLVFLLNGLMGVAADDLFHDYELTSLSGVGRRLSSSLEFQKMLGVLQSYAPPRSSLPRQIEGYLANLGLDPSLPDRLRSLLVERLD